MGIAELLEKLGQGEIVRLATADWDRLKSEVDIVESHDTCMRGMLLIVQTSTGLAAVEEPETNTRAVRPLADRASASEFVAARMKIYERMWDGCGCKVDYFNESP